MNLFLHVLLGVLFGSFNERLLRWMRGDLPIHSVSYSFLFPYISFVLCIFAWALHPSSIIVSFFVAIILYGLFLATIFDLLYQEIPNICTTCIAIAGIFLSVFSSHVLLSFGGLGIIVLWFGCLSIFTKGRGVGTGDIFLAAAIAFWLGMTGTILLIFFSFAIGGIFSGFFLMWHRTFRVHMRIPFVPFLALGTLCVLLGFGQKFL